MIISYRTSGIVAVLFSCQNVSEDHLPNLADLIGLGQTGHPRLDVHDLGHRIAGEDVVTSTLTLDEPEIQQGPPEIVEADVGIGRATQYPGQHLLAPRHATIMPAPADAVRCSHQRRTAPLVWWSSPSAWATARRSTPRAIASPLDLHQGALAGYT